MACPTYKTTYLQRNRIVRLFNKTSIRTVTLHNDIAIPVTNGSRCGILQVILIIVLHNPGTLRARYLLELTHPGRSVDFIIQFSAPEVITGNALFNVRDIFTEHLLRTFYFLKSLGIHFKESGRLFCTQPIIEIKAPVINEQTRIGHTPYLTAFFPFPIFRVSRANHVYFLLGTVAGKVYKIDIIIIRSYSRCHIMVNIKGRCMYLRIKIDILPCNQVIGYTITADIHCSKEIIFVFEQYDYRIGSRTGFLLSLLETSPAVIQIHRITKRSLLFRYLFVLRTGEEKKRHQ